MTTVGASAVERPIIGKMLEGEVSRRMATVRSIRFPGVGGFTVEQHLAVAQAQLLEILQYGAPGRPLHLDQVYDHFVIALSHLGAARDTNVPPLAQWTWTTGSDPVNYILDDSDDPPAPTSRELYNAARERGETVGDEWGKRSQDGASG